MGAHCTITAGVCEVFIGCYGATCHQCQQHWLNSENALLLLWTTTMGAHCTITTDKHLAYSNTKRFLLHSRHFAYWVRAAIWAFKAKFVSARFKLEHFSFSFMCPLILYVYVKLCEIYHFKTRWIICRHPVLLKMKYCRYQIILC